MIATVTKKAVTAETMFGQEVTLTRGMELNLTKVMETNETTPPQAVYIARVPGTDDTVKINDRELGMWCVCRPAKDLGYE